MEKLATAKRRSKKEASEKTTVKWASDSCPLTLLWMRVRIDPLAANPSRATLITI